MTSVVAVVVTWNRRALLERALAALGGQSHPLARIVVVDNASTDDTPAFLRERSDEITAVTLPENAGYGAGLAVGMREAMRDAPHWVWTFDDDSAPTPDALATLLSCAAAAPDVAAWTIGHGPHDVPDPAMHESWLPLHVKSLGDVRAIRCRKTLIDGALIAGDAIRRFGHPRSDYFMMMEDYEYFSRMADAHSIVVRATLPIMQRDNVGSVGMAPWRMYYQARNHVAMALDRRDVGELGFCIRRQGRRMLHTIAHVRPSNLAWSVDCLRMRTLGLIDGVTGRMGRTIEPSTGRRVR